MATRPVEIPEWSTDLNYTTGPDIGTPTKVDPGAGKRDEGWVPTERPPAQHWNFMANLLGSWIDFVKDIEWLNWQAPDPVGSGLDSLSGTQCFAIAWDADGGGSGVERWVMAINSASATQKIAFSLDGSTWALSAAHPSIGSVLHPSALIYSPTASLWILSTNAGTSEILTSPDGNTWTARNDPDAGSARYGMADNGSIIVMCRDSASGFLSSTDAITWTARANPATGTMRGVAWSPSLSLFAAVGALGDIATSPDGITWTDRSAGSPTSDTLIDVVWEPVAAQFVAVSDTTGRVITSADGITWADRGIPIAGVDGSAIDVRGVATDGGGNILAAGSVGLSVGGTVGFSNDGGVTWRQHQLGGIPFGPVVLRGVRYENGRWVTFGETVAGLAQDPMYAFSLKMNP